MPESTGRWTRTKRVPATGCSYSPSKKKAPSNPLTRRRNRPRSCSAARSGRPSALTTCTSPSNRPAAAKQQARAKRRRDIDRAEDSGGEIPPVIQTSYNTIDLRGKRVEEGLRIMDQEFDRMVRGGIRTRGGDPRTRHRRDEGSGQDEPGAEPVRRRLPAR